MKPHDVKYHICPRCKEQAIVLVAVEDNARFDRDDMGNIQYHCTNCHTTFSVGCNGKAIRIKLGF